ncbi:MAG: phosphate acyltransferase [Verrucomicrobiota bacterium]|nr:phosphate acyltransferase [Verrucomicrobiota bacterium]
MKFIESVYAKLHRHPKRIVFPDGEEPKIIRAASEYTRLLLGPAILLGDPEKIRAIGKEVDADLKRVLVIQPEHAADLELFVKRLETVRRYQGMKSDEARKLVTHCDYFAALMIQNGQADGIVGGLNRPMGSLLRPLFSIVKPLPGIKSVSSCLIMQTPNKAYGHNGVFFMADCGVIPDPTVEQLAEIGLETARLARQLTGEMPYVAFLSYSTKGSAKNKITDKIAAATALAKQKANESKMEVEIDGELELESAIVPESAAKLKGSPVAGKANVLIFPDLNSGCIASQMLHRLASADVFGQIILGLDRPAADLFPGVTVDDIVGVSAIVGLQAIEYHRLYPDKY